MGKLRIGAPGQSSHAALSETLMTSQPLSESPASVGPESLEEKWVEPNAPALEFSGPDVAKRSRPRDEAPGSALAGVGN